jgi:6-pyruvoyltetrahydropterin/6-carboxytetrahydropterin synthase
MAPTIAASIPTATAIRIAKRWPVSYSHWLPTPGDHRWCGHNCAVEVGLAAAELDAVGMVFDYGELGAVKGLLEARVDHRHLDDEVLTRPAACEDTARQVAAFVHQQLAGDTSLAFAPLVCDVEVEDIWHGYVPRPWQSVAQRLGFHSAHWLEGLPEGHKCGRKHGHGYLWGVERDPAAGGADRDVLQPAVAFVQRRLHQQLLNDVLGGLNPTAEHLVWFLGLQFTAELQIPGIRRVVVAETPTTLAEWRAPEDGA